MLKSKATTLYRVECNNCGKPAEDTEGYESWWNCETDARRTARDDEFTHADDHDICGTCTRQIITDANGGPDQSVFDAVWGSNTTAPIGVSQ